MTLSWDDAWAVLEDEVANLVDAGQMSADDIDLAAVLGGLRVEVDPVEGPGESVELPLAGTATDVVVSGLRNGVDYRATVTARGENGVAEASAPVVFTPTTGVEGEIGGVLIKRDDAAKTAPASQVARGVTDVALTDDGEAVEGVDKVLLSEAVDVPQAEAIADTIEAEPEVQWAEPDLVVLPASVSAADMIADAAWNISGDYGVGEVTDPDAGSGVTVAVIDTGVTDHPDLRDRLVPGYDFVSNPEVLAAARTQGGEPVAFDGDYAGDFGGQGRDADSSDPGDWRGVAPVRDSSWHGTHIAGVIADVIPGAQIQPIRALSWRGGLLSDVAAGITWASGGSVEGVPANATPSQVINLSFSVHAACPNTLQAAIDGAVARGSVIVAAAGNSNDDASNYAPGNCANVITVGATNADGKRANYSNYGTVVDFAAPGGATNSDGGIRAASNTGTTTPAALDTAAREGTSIAAAHASAALALIASGNPDATPDDLTRELTGRYLRSFPGESCDAAGDKSCGTGLLQIASSPVAFTCQPKLYQSASPGPRLYVYDATTNTYSAVGGATSGGPNGMGYNTGDDYIYANYNSTLIQVDANGTYTNRGSLTQGGKSIGNYNSGDFWGQDRLLLGKNNSNAWKSVDVSNPDAPVVTDFPLTGDTFGPMSADFTVLGNTAYGLSPQGTTTPMILSVVNLVTQEVTNKTTSGEMAGDNQGVGAAYADALGNVYFHRNTGSVYKVAASELSKANPLVVSMGAPPTFSGSTLTPANDGASCPNAASAFSSTISNEASSAVSANAAQVTADVNPNGAATTAVICFGTSSATSGGALQGCTDSSQPANASTAAPLTGTAATSLTPVTLSGLSARTTYYWQVVTTSAYATTYGDVASFTTTGVPTVATQPASSVGTASAVLNGVVNPGGRSTTVTFCVGTASDLTGCASEAAAESPLAAGTSDTSVSATLSGLAPGTRYYARVDATNADGSASGSIVSFTTSAPPQATINSASDITSTDARLNGTVNPEGLSTAVSFCYGTSSDLSGCTTVAAAESPLVAVSADASVTADLTGLTASTTYYVQATAVSANGTTTSGTTSFTTSARPLVLTTTTGALTTGTVGSSYSKTLSADGGTAPYTWSVASGALPAGLSLDSTTGAITGTPTADGAATFTAEVTDATAQTATRSFTITVVAEPEAETAAASAVGTTTATLNGSVDPGNLLTTAQFCYGTAADLTGCSTVTADESPLAASTSSSSVSATLVGLASGTTYYARTQAANSAGSDTGAIVSFTTASAPTATTGEATFRTKAETAILNATVDDGGLDTTISLCHSTTPTMSSPTCVAADQSPLSAGSGETTVSADVTGLTLGAVYYFNVTATNAGGTSVGSTVEFTMPLSTAATPTITDVSPSSGDASGGTSMTITGTNFSTTGAQSTVTIGTASATVTSVTATSITATVPAGTVGAVDVIVHNIDGQAVREVNGFTYTSSNFAVTYDANGATSGSAPTDGATYTYGETATILNKGSLARTGYDFTGWNTAADGSGTDYLALASATVTSDVTLYAQWEGVPILGTSTTSLDFGTQQLEDGPTAAQTVTVTNSGGGVLTINAGGITVSGSASADFSVTGGTCSAGGSVAAGSSCTVEAEFDPTATGSRNVVLTVATSGGTVAVSLWGVGTSSTPTPTPTPSSSSGSGSSPGSSTPVGPSPVTRTPPPLTRAPVGVVLGGGYVLVDGELVAVRPEPAPTGGAWTVAGPDFSLEFTPQTDASGNLTGPAEVLTSPAGDWVDVEGDGYLGQSTVSAYLVPASSMRIAVRVTSEPVYLGEVPVEADGTFRVRLTIPVWATPGVYAIQVNGWSPSESVRSVTIALDVTDPAPSLVVRSVTKAAFFQGASDDLSRNGRRKLRALVRDLPPSREDVQVWITAVSTPMSSLEADLRLAARRGAQLRTFLSERGVTGTFRVSVTTEEQLRSKDVPPLVLSSKGKPLTTVRIDYSVPSNR